VVTVTTYKTQLTETTPFVNYQFRVKANNQQGAGEWSMTHGDLGPSPDVQFNFNKATGGNVPEGVEVTDYNGTGETWRVHTFTGPGTKTFNVEMNPREFTVLVTSGGGRGGGGNAYYSVGGQGGRGETLVSDEIKFDLGDTDVVVAGSNGVSSAGGLEPRAGGNGGGAWNNGGQFVNGANGTGYPVVQSDIEGGGEKGYGGAVGSPNKSTCNTGGKGGNFGGGGGGGGGNSNDLCGAKGGGAGGDGQVIIAYRTG
jgi:hypothetical protein